MNYRIDILKKYLVENNIDSFLVSNYYNIYYLSGFKTLVDNERESWMLVTKSNCYLFTDARYTDEFKIRNSLLRSSASLGTPDGQVKIKVITAEQGLIYHLQQICEAESIKKIAFEGEDLKHLEHQKLKERLINAELISTERIIIKQREKKDSQEIENIKKACIVADECLSQIIKTIKTDTTEKEIAFRLEYYLKEKEYEIAFNPIIAIDKNSSLPHYDTKTGDGKVMDGSIILIDFGAKHKDYCSDITRMIFFGKQKDEIINTYNKLLNAQKKTITYLKEIKKLKSADEYCRKLMLDNGLLNYPHSTGHGVGLQIHEYPKVSQTSQDIKESGQVFTIEPGAYYEKKWGIRIEDTVVIKNEEAEILTKFVKEPIILEENI